MRNRRFALVLAAFLAFPLLAADAPPPAKPPEAAKPEPPPEPVKFISKHHLQSGATDISYTATAEEFYLKDNAGKPTASFFTTAYVKDGVARPEDRPVTFVFNGGPGPAAGWLHLRVLRPKLIDNPPHGSPPRRPPPKTRRQPATPPPAPDLLFVASARPRA